MSKNIFKIYSIINQIDEKIYIGKTSQFLQKRWWQHVNKAKNNYVEYLYRAMRKHGYENFVIKQIDCAKNELECSELEKAYIGMYQSYKPEFGYNLTLGGDGCVPSEETRYKMSISQIGKKHSTEQNRKISLSLLGNKHALGKTHSISEEHKKALSIALTGNKNFMGHTHSNETRQKLRITKLGILNPMYSKTRENCPNYRLDISNQQIAELYSKTKNTCEVSRLLNVSQSLIYNRLKNTGVL